MDANRQRPHQLAAREDWAVRGDGRVAWDAGSRQLRLIGARAPRWTEDTITGNARRDLAPGAIDRFGTHAQIERVVRAGVSNWRVVVSGAVAGSVELVPPQLQEISDAAIAGDVLYLAIGGAVRLQDLRDRWDPMTVAVAGGEAWRLAPSATGVHVAITEAGPGNGAVVALGEISGRPMRRLPEAYDPAVFRPQPEDPDPPRFIAGGAPPADGVAAIATSPAGRLAVVAWDAGDGDARLYVREATGVWSAPRQLAGTRRPYSLSWLDDDRVAVLIATEDNGTTAAVYGAGDGGDGPVVVAPVGELFPLLTPAPLPFLHGVETPPRYLSRQRGGDQPQELLPLSWPAFATTGEVAATTPIDGLTPGAVWHRIYLEAAVPPGSAVTVWLAATESRQRPAGDDAWFPHHFGGAATAVADDAPRGAWIDAASEVPYHHGMLGCERRPGIAGLFTALVQRRGRRVRALAGRYLWVRVTLAGDGRVTPELAALRVYGGRRGYAGLYLPELYREDAFGPDAEAAGTATPADFLDRFLGLFESVLTPLEDRIAGAWLLTHPRTTHDDAVDWLASWLGFVFAADLPAPRRRAMLDQAWALYQRRGTLAGLSRALDVASGGGVSRREIVVIEDFRLRRTFATVLGADLSNPEDVLTPGLITSGNSIVGDTLILGAEERRAFLALFDEDLVLGNWLREAIDEAQIDALFDRLAHRVTVLVHQEIADHDLGLLRQIIALEAPAHVQVKVVTATYRFRVAVSSLVGVDTYLGSRPAQAPVRIDRSQLGVADVIERLPSLDPRLGRTS